MTGKAGGPGKADEGGAELRREPRLPVRLRATLLVYRDRYDVVIVDLSNNGAMVTGEGAMPLRGEEVVLAQDGFQAVATVAWTAGANAGLVLHRSIDAVAVARTLREAARRREEART